MAKFALRQIVKFALLMVAVSVVVFVLVDASPIDPVQANIGQAAYLNMSEAKRAQLAEYWGVGTPVWERYLSWAASFLQGDWGTSLRFNAPVADVIAVRALNSLALMGIAWVASGVFGFALGIVAAVCRGRLADRAIKGYCCLLASVPTFWLGLVFLMVFAVILKWFPIGFSVPIGMSAADVTLADAARHIALPAIVLSLLGVANIALHTREKAIDVLESPYVRFARARGMGVWQALCRHGLRNLALPAVTLQFASISEIFGGSVLVEQVFSYPGLGQAAVTAGLGADVELLAGIALVSAALVFGGNLAANVLYGVVDPRLRPARTTRAAGEGPVGAGEALQGAGEGLAAAGGAPRAASEASRSMACAGEGFSAAREARAAEEAPLDETGASAAPIALGARAVAVPAPVRLRSHVIATAASAGMCLHRPRARRMANRRVTFIVCAAALAALAAVVVAGILLSDAATATDFAQKNLAPGVAHLFGTDWMGRDMLARTIAGLSTSVLVGLLAAGCSALIALALGTVAALGGKRADAVVTWLIDLVMGLPHIVLLILISFALGRGFTGVVVGVALTHWPSLARVVRAEVLQCKESGHVATARRLGAGRVRIAVKHVLPYVLPQFIVGLILLFPHAILHEAAITFLGFGLPPEQPAVGVILSEAMSYLSAGMWWLAVFPGAALVAVVLLFDVAGSSLRKLVDPHRAQE